MAFLGNNVLGRAGLIALAFVSFSVANIRSVSGQETPPAATTSDDTTSDTTSADNTVESAVVAAITASPVLNVQPITATTARGEVTLSGSVDDAASKELAQMVVAKVEGVRTVVNRLSIVPLGAPTADNSAAADSGQDPQQPVQEAAPSQQTEPPQQATSDQQGPTTAGYPGATPSSRPPYNRIPPPQRHPPAAQGQYPPSQTSPTGPVEIPQGTLVTVRLSEPLDTRRLDQGAMFQASAARDIYVGGALAVPRGATLEGQVVDVRTVKGSLSGSPSVSLKLNAIVLEGRSYPLATDVWVGNGPGKGGYTAGNTITGAAIGAVIGGMAGGGAGAAVGATLGGATGAVASSASNGPRVVLPPETVLTFHLTTPVTVDPVTSQEAQRLASSQRGPSLERRPGYARPPVAYGYPYGYPSPYPYVYGYPYRPYYYPRNGGGGYYRR